MYGFNIAAILVLLAVMAVTFGITAGQVDDASAQIEEFKTHDDLLLDVAELVPEFGGKFISEDGDILYVHVLEGSEETLETDHVRSAIESAFSTRATGGRELRLIPAKYSMHQLHEWYRKMQDVVWSSPDVVMTDLQEAKNRIDVGVKHPQAVPEIEASVAALGVPSDALVVEVREGLVLQSHTLQDRAPGGVMVGGYQIKSRYLDEDGRWVRGDCTLGFNVYRTHGVSGEAGFITAGHCTEDDWDGGVDHTKFYQPDPDDNANLVGKEKIDPPFSSTLKGCPTSKICRWSDSAFAKLTLGASRDQGMIAKVAINSTTVSHDDEFRIVGERTLTVVGQTVHKVGKNSGLTEAVVNETCADYVGLKNRHLLCQYRATITKGKTQGGDSGGPVFVITNSPNADDVELAGIHHSGGVNERRFTFSPIGNVYLDLGRSNTWRACAPGFDC